MGALSADVSRHRSVCTADCSMCARMRAHVRECLYARTGKGLIEPLLACTRACMDQGGLLLVNQVTTMVKETVERHATHSHSHTAAQTHTVQTCRGHPWKCYDCQLELTLRFDRALSSIAISKYQLLREQQFMLMRERALGVALYSALLRKLSAVGLLMRWRTIRKGLCQDNIFVMMVAICISHLVHCAH